MNRDEQAFRSRISSRRYVDEKRWTRSEAFDRLLRDVLIESGRELVNRTETSVVPTQHASQATPTAAPRTTRVSGVYIISVAARLANMHPQTLRKYERAGLVSPARTGGALRLYSDNDVRRLRIIRRLVGDLGLNVAGVSVVLEIVRRLQDVMDVLEQSPELADSRAARLAAAELKTIFNYLGTDDDQAARKE